MNTFQVGKTYATRSVCDHNCIISLTITARTAKTVKAMVRGEVKTLRVSEYNGEEIVKPWGSYSMAPLVGASDVQ
jgi:hypothetical protein